MGGLGGILLLSLLGASISGVVVASIAKLILPGKQHVTGIELFLIGTGAAWVGGFLAGLIGLGENRKFGFDDVAVIAIQVIIAAIAIILWTNFRNNQVKKAIVPDMPSVPGPVGGTSDKKDKDKGDNGGPNVPGVPGI